MDAFSAPTLQWFSQNFDGPTAAQQLGWPLIASGGHVLITAPTGSGKTLAAFLFAIDRLMVPTSCPSQDKGQAVASVPGAPGTRVLYISPLKALVYDIERNLRAPLAGIARFHEATDQSLPMPRVGIRTGDTSSKERLRQLKDPPEILVTTPESLYLLLGSRAADNLRSVTTVIVDEVHALASTKRGVHLALSLERLSAHCDQDPQRIGLSATIRPLDEAARFLGGRRKVEVLDCGGPPRLDLQIKVPVADMENPPVARKQEPSSGPILGELYRRPLESVSEDRGMWSAIYPALLREIERHRSTIIFVNSRGLCERLCHRLNEIAQGDDGGEEIALAHHGSVSHEQRAQIEDGLKRGTIKAIVATSSLEMGIDMGGVDQVLLVESPGSVARGLQRVGRAGHGVGEVSNGRIYPKFRGDLLECAVIAGRMLRGELESARMPRNVLDVLAQQVTAYCCEGERSVEEIHALITRAGPYLDISRAALEAVLDMLSGRFPSTDFADIKPLLSWDRTKNLLSPRKGASMVTRLNGGTIPDRGNYAVHLGAEGPRIGELDEEMVFETKAGDCILLGSSTWRVEQITRDRVAVSPAPGEPGRLPFWRGEGPGRPLELGHAIGAFCRGLSKLRGAKAQAWIMTQAPLDEMAAANLGAYIEAQRRATGEVPSDRVIVVERFRDELGDWRICILSPFGSRIHAPWAMAIQWLLERREGFEIQVMYTDDGIVLRIADGEALPELSDLLPPVEELEERVTHQLANTALFASLFRENAARALLMPRRSAKGRRPLWAQRLKAQSLLAAVQRYPSFPVVLETYRQALSDIFDLAGLETVLRGIASRSIRIHEVETRHASPFARSLVFAYVAAYIYEQDAPIAERRAQALALDRNLLAELLGQAELRDLIDPEVLEQIEDELQHRASGRQARDADELHDLLRRVGDLTTAALMDRCEGDLELWLRVLTEQRRVISVRLAGEERWIAAEDAALYRDAAGCVPPPGLPDAFLEGGPDALEQLLRRYARTRGPFAAEEAARRFGLRTGHVEPVLRLLELRGDLVHGEIRPFGSTPEWCDQEVMRQIRRRTLAKARDAVTPVDHSALGRFLPAWQGVGEGRKGSEALLHALLPLEGLTLSWSLLNQKILPARVTGFRPEEFDMLAAMGQVVWVGCGAAGPRDGRIAVYRREAIGQLLDPSELGQKRNEVEQESAQDVILRHLERRGASFLSELMQALELAGFKAQDTITSSLWDLVWSGLMTNDTFAPLRALNAGPSKRQRGAAAALAGGRWSLVVDLLNPCSDTERSLARARMLLERYGVVSREAVSAEGLAGGFGPLYQVLKQMEESGAVRRGYFVEGLSGAQFGLAGAVDRLRAARDDDRPLDGYGQDAVSVLAAADPANPFGALLPWPQSPAGQAPKRTHGAYLVLVAGRPTLYLAAGGKQLTSFACPEAERGADLKLAAAALHQLPRIGRKRLQIQMIDGIPVTESPLRTLFLSAGFDADYDALVQARGFA
ncbi:DEAD/DEAH box helicase [Thiorhodococcus mannitoliphagus]|uniref:DEAD/DEAH box helicase n=1 Tax=Thiorhodococcus mannitoliphagus TaxID=329406 RepID=A0A6P1E254_9GAMM|nr:DEAD/DEAH box helicase [Thiorhodococcus mannitoliphagus]NEX23431.1 DEAD/DEAH box helicase [Thiorhodococcus mannitoliphagus]